MAESQDLSRPVASRLQVPADYGIDPDKLAGMLDWSWAEERLTQAHNYWLATTQPDGKPHAMPIWGVWLDATYYFSTGRASHKGRNLAQNPEVVIHLESGDEVVIMEGRAEEVSEAALISRMADIYAAKYNGIRPVSDQGSAVYAVPPRLVFGWLESDFPNTATRWQF